ncbi:MAG: elongation factor G [Planctomycetes bacterium]|nr:elongation factor G [Planctomycetota bacterium]
MPRNLQQLRNIGIIAHIDAGKTTLTERVLYYTGATHRMGDVDEGTTVTDYLAEEQERGITITAACITCHWNDVVINLIDTPGHVDFTAEVERSLRVLDGAVVVFSAVEGVEAQSETVWRQADKYRVPRLCFINKMDRIGADFRGTLEQITERLQANPVAVQIPIGAESNFQGIVDLIDMRAFVFTPESLGATVVEKDIPVEFQEQTQAWHDRLILALADVDDEVMSHYLEGKPISAETIRRVLRRATLHHGVTPVFCGSALKYVGVQRLLDGVASYLPSPLDVPPVEGFHPKHPERKERRKADPKEPFCGLVFKIQADPHGDLYFVRVYSGALKAGTRVLNTGKNEKEIVSRLWHMHADSRERVDEVEAGDIVGVVGLKASVTGDTLCDTRHPLVLEAMHFPDTVISMAIEPESSADREKLGTVLNLLKREDPTFEYRVNEETGQTLISGMGELHLEIIENRMLRDFNLDVRVHRPRVSYRETIQRPVRVEGRCVKQTGGAGLYAKVVIEMKPFHGEQSITFESRIKGGVIPLPFIAAVEKGVREEAHSGGRAGYPLIDVKFTLVDGDTHEVDSSDLAFEFAAADAVRKGLDEAGVVLLEPIMHLEVITPEDYLGDVLGDLTARRGEITETQLRGKLRVIEARVPLAEMFGYATRVRSLSQGRASYTMEPLTYAPAPEAVAVS